MNFVDYLKELGFYSEEQAKQIKISTIISFFMKVKPDFSQTHGVRALMQNYFLFQNQTYELVENKIRLTLIKYVILLMKC